MSTNDNDGAPASACDCTFEWNGGSWDNVSGPCTEPGYICSEPTDIGTTVGQRETTACRLIAGEKPAEDGDE